METFWMVAREGTILRAASLPFGVRGFTSLDNLSFQNNGFSYFDSFDVNPLP
jgi:hypothetical protein